MGLVGPGFVGAHHVDAVRRLGFVDVVAICDVTEAQAARAAGVVHAVMFNYRGNPMVQEARAMVASGDLGPIHFVHGAYLQDWLLEPSDFSWRLEPDHGGPSLAFGDIGSHWVDLVQHVLGRRIESVLADLTTVVPVRQKPRTSREAFAGGDAFAYRLPAQGSRIDAVQLQHQLRDWIIGGAERRYANTLAFQVGIGVQR